MSFSPKIARQAHRRKAPDLPNKDGWEDATKNSICRKIKSARKAKRILTRWTTSWNHPDENDKNFLVTNEYVPDDIKKKDKKVSFAPELTTENKDRKVKKSKKGWKRIRHAALLACQYIGMGVSQLSPVNAYPSPDFYMDSYNWYNPYEGNYNNCRAQSYWTTGFFLNGW